MATANLSPQIHLLDGGERRLLADVGRIDPESLGAAGVLITRVATPSGQSTDTPMPCGARSFARVSDRPTTAYFEVL